MQAAEEDGRAARFRYAAKRARSDVTVAGEVKNYVPVTDEMLLQTRSRATG